MHRPADPTWISMTLVSACLLVAILPERSAPGGEIDDHALRRFEAEYPEANQRLESFYGKLRIVVKETWERGPTRAWEVSGNGASIRRVDLDQSEGITPDSKPSYATVAGEGLSFRLKKAPGSSGYLIISQSSSDPQVRESLVRSIRRNAKVASAPFSIFESTIPEFLSQDGTRVTGARESHGPYGGTVTIEWESTAPGSPRRYGFFTFAPDACWALREYEFHYDHVDGKTGQRMDTGEIGVLEYSGERDGIPLVRKIQLSTIGPAGKFPQMTAEVTELTPGAVSKSEFTLEAFGIRTAPTTAPIPVMYYLMALSGAGGLAAACFIYLQRRSAAQG